MFVRDQRISLAARPTARRNEIHPNKHLMLGFPHQWPEGELIGGENISWSYLNIFGCNKISQCGVAPARRDCFFLFCFPQPTSVRGPLLLWKDVKHIYIDLRQQLQFYIGETRLPISTM